VLTVGAKGGGVNNAFDRILSGFAVPASAAGRWFRENQRRAAADTATTAGAAAAGSPRLRRPVTFSQCGQR